ncbi:MAG TPA: FHA domain-containing protein [Blastocatellia bacterium]|nr:FHA domain-containing protein [Blastocatellia bacterium]
MEVMLTVHTADGTRQLRLDSSRLTLGRGEEADLCLNDQGSSRLHASIHCEGERVWLVDEGSTNGSFVNGQPVPPNGAVLSDGDQIRLGNETIIAVSFIRPKAATQPKPRAAAVRQKTATRGSKSPAPLIAAALVLLMLVIGGGAWALNWLSRGSDQTTAGDNSGTPEPVTSPSPGSDESTPVASGTVAGVSPDPGAVTPLPDISPSPASSGLPGASVTPGGSPGVFRLYLKMTPAEQEGYVYEQARRISETVGNRPCTFDNPIIRKRIKDFVDNYARRVGNHVQSGWGADLSFVFERGQKHAPLIIRSFDQQQVSPLVGLYIAMIETEFQQICKENFAGAAGMFQFIAATARDFGLDPDERCNVEKMAPAAARYMKQRISEFGGDATSVCLAIAGYNRSPFSVRRDLHTVLNSRDRERSFWTLMLNDQKLDHYFQENLKYVPKFFAAAIVGENPDVFGLKMKPLSTYTESATKPGRAD